jgi:hypothetical protein
MVSTSPVSELFPAGIPVGRVESVNLSKSPAPEAIIELSVPINVLEWVEVKPSKILPDKQLSAPPPVQDTRSADEPQMSPYGSPSVQDTRSAEEPQMSPDGSQSPEAEKPSEPQPNDPIDASTETPPLQEQDQR